MNLDDRLTRIIERTKAEAERNPQPGTEAKYNFRDSIFALAQTLKGLPEYAQADPIDLGHIVKRWMAASCEQVKSKSYDDVLATFAAGWDRVKHPGGMLAEALRIGMQNVPDWSQAIVKDSEAGRKVAAMVAQLARDGEGEFWLNQEAAATAIGCAQETISFWLGRFRAGGIIERANTPQRGKSGEYRMLGQQDTTDFIPF
jgi:hypothetical protein